jgi:NlpC/P60 family putative phage cell wall peptidase
MVHAPEWGPDEALRQRVVEAARAWIGTPYRHQASTRGAGCDCLGIVRGVFRDIYGAEPERPPPYTAAWAEERAEETLRDAALRHLEPVSREEFRAGDVLLFRLRERGPAKHCAIAVSRTRMIHAYDRHAVAECAIPESWARRLAYAFRFPTLAED